MANEKMIRLSQAARELNVGISTLTDTLAAKGQEVENKANAKITIKQLEMLADEFGVSLSDLKISANLNMNKKYAEKSDTQVAVQDPPANQTKKSTQSKEEKPTQPKEEKSTQSKEEKPTQPKEEKSTQSKEEKPTQPKEEKPTQPKEEKSTQSKEEKPTQPS